MVYFDNAATAPPYPETIDAVAEAMRTVVGNPASLHRAGLVAEDSLKASKAAVACAFGVAPEELVLTSGGTESIATAFAGFPAANPRQPRRVVSTAAEHPAVLRTLERLESQGFEVVRVPVDGSGRIRLEALEAALSVPTGMVSLLHVNNETGAVQPMDEVAAVLRAKAPDAALHLDAVQTFGKAPLALRRWGVRLASFSAHKFHGPKGIGVLYVAKGTRIAPLLVGGGQQGGLRSGTENPPLAAGLAAAADGTVRRTAAREETVRRLRARILAGLDGLPGGPARILSPDDGTPAILNLAFPGVKPEPLVNALSQRGICISTVSACAARSRRTSHVLLAMGVPESVASCAIRISTSVLNREEEADAFLAALSEALALLLPKR